MAPDAALERTVGKILDETEGGIASRLREALDASNRELDGAVESLGAEYDRIVADGRKEAEKIERQIVGSADLDVRNRQLLLVQESVDRAFAAAADRIRGAERGEEYSKMIRALLAESVEALGTPEITVACSGGDAAAVRSCLAEFPGSRLSPEPVDCMGGVRAASNDGSMTFDNTLDARLERLKPLIRKEIALKFGLD